MNNHKAPRNRNETAKELMDRLNKDPDFVQRREERERRYAEAEAIAMRASEGVLRELTEVGFPCDDVDNIVKTYCPLPPAIVSCLLKWIPQIDHDNVKEMLIRALGAAEQKFSCKVLADAYDSCSHSIGVQFAVLNTIAMTNPTDIDDFITRIAESEHIRKQLRDLGYKFKKRNGLG